MKGSNLARQIDEEYKRKQTYQNNLMRKKQKEGGESDKQNQKASKRKT